MSDKDSGTDKNEVTSLAVAIVALVVALVALVGTTAQVLQQYLATAVGYSNCGKRVMGTWARHTKLVFHPWELRFEVVFKSPEIFLRSCDMKSVRANKVDDDPAELMHLVKEKAAIGDYSATWLSLLTTLHDMEFRREDMLQSYNGWVIDVVVHDKTQTLDLMPEGVKKPYATTTLSTIVCLAAMMGIHWKQFDRTNDRYAADGNGLLITGSAVPYLGIMFTFTRYGIAEFRTERVIPALDIKQLYFGLVPTIFRPPGDPSLESVRDVSRDIETLRFGSPAEIAATLSLLGCDRRIVDSAGFAGHLYPGKQIARHVR